jgi:hypothetical protein
VIIASTDRAETERANEKRAGFSLQSANKLVQMLTFDLPSVRSIGRVADRGRFVATPTYREESMSISEVPVEEELLVHIRGAAESAAEILGVDPAEKSAAEVVHAIDQCAYQWQKGKRPEMDEEEDLSLLLGALWGEQLCRALGWEWSGVVFHKYDDAHAVGVFSPDRSLAIYPFHFTKGCLENEASVTIELAFNMLLDGSEVPQLPANGFENVMDNVQHIVPRD